MAQGLAQYQIDEQAFAVADSLHPEGDNDPQWEVAYNAARKALMEQARETFNNQVKYHQS